MLKITRNVGEGFWVGEETHIRFDGFSDHNHKQIRLSICAPRNIKIMREELLDRDFNEDELFLTPGGSDNA